ncbi:MAG TPA: hypothetical protein VJA19_07805 [Pseudomonas sp.]|nr:hypothetical protein [Pseudomonas sp.]
MTYGDCRNFRQWPDYLALGLGPEHVPDLIRMATDPDLNWADSESLEVWAPVHAWRALGQLRAEAAIEPLLALFHELEDSDWAPELSEVFGLIGPTAIPALMAYLTDPQHGLYPRAYAADSLGEIAKHHPEARAASLAALIHEFERFADNEPELNGFILAALLDLNAVEAAPLIERAFAAGRVDVFIAGDWEEVQIEFGLKAERSTPRHRWPWAEEFDRLLRGAQPGPSADEISQRLLAWQPPAAEAGAATHKRKRRRRRKG